MTLLVAEGEKALRPAAGPGLDAAVAEGEEVLLLLLQGQVLTLFGLLEGEEALLLLLPGF